MANTGNNAFITGVKEPSSTRSSRASSYGSLPMPVAYDAGHEFQKGVEEAEELERARQEAELEELKHRVFKDQWEAEKQRDAAEEIRRENEKLLENFHRPNTVHTIRSKTREELAESKLLLPRGLKFKPLVAAGDTPRRDNDGRGAESSSSSVASITKTPKSGNKLAKTLKQDARKALVASNLLPKSLLDASKTIRNVEKYAPVMMQEITYDLEVLLGNKSALGASKEKALIASSDTTGAAKSPKSKVKPTSRGQTNVLAAEAGVDLGRQGARFGGGAGGRPILASKKPNDVLSESEKEQEQKALAAIRPLSPDGNSAANLPTKDGDAGMPISTRLLGLPGHLAMSVLETEKYFGEQSRINFADRCQWMASQRKITNFVNVPNTDQYGHKVIAGKQRTLVYEQNGFFGTDAVNAEIPFAPIRDHDTSDFMKTDAMDSSRFPSLSGTVSSRNTTKAGIAGAAVTSAGEGTSTAAMKDSERSRGASRGGRGGIFTRGGIGAGADTTFFDTTAIAKKKTGYVNTLPGGTDIASENGVPNVTLPLSPFGSPATGKRPEVHALGSSTDDNIMTANEISEAYRTPGYVPALKGSHTSMSKINTGNASAVDKKTKESMETLHSFDKMLELTDFISHDLAEHKIVSAKELEYHFRGVKNGDYSCLGGGKSAIAGGPKSHYQYVSVHAPKYDPMPAAISDDEEDEGPYAYPVPTGKRKKKKNMRPTAREILQLTEAQDAIEMEQELVGLALQRKIFIDANHDDIPGHDLPEASVTSRTYTDDAGIPTSPRSQYIDACLREGVNPRASLVLRKGLTKTLDLSHHGIGDKMGKVLSECILDLPYLQSISIADNRLTDSSLGPLVAALVKMPNILNVDLSNNVVGDVASNTLSNYLGTESCPLVKLVMRNADVDDYECTRFVTAIKDNKCTKLQELDLTQNLLGSAEQLNVVMPELTTAGEAFAELIETSSCQLSRLELGWNMIRGDSAIAFAVSLSQNTSITYLDISYNAFGRGGGRELGRALMSNRTLTHLNVSSNNLEGTAIFCICVGLIENKNMRRLILDGNPIGSLGAKAVMQVPTMIGSRVKVSVVKCNISIPPDANAAEVSFDFENLLRIYVLDMTSAYDRAQAFMLLFLIACHHTFVISKWEWEESKGQIRSYDLVPFLNPDKQEYFTEKQKLIEIALETTIRAASDVSLAIAFFNDIDVDGSGELDRGEFKQLMDKIGIELDDERLEDVFDTYDTDQGGTIGVDEFLVFLKRQKVETESRLYDLTQTPAFCQKKDLEFNKKGNIMQANTAGGLDIVVPQDGLGRPKGDVEPKRRYLPPTTGKLTINVEGALLFVILVYFFYMCVYLDVVVYVLYLLPYIQSLF